MGRSNVELGIPGSQVYGCPSIPWICDTWGREGDKIIEREREKYEKFKKNSLLYWDTRMLSVAAARDMW